MINSHTVASFHLPDFQSLKVSSEFVEGMSSLSTPAAPSVLDVHQMSVA